MNASRHANITAVWPRTGWLLLLGGLIVAALVGLKNPVVLLLLLTDGLMAALVLAAATLGGWTILPLLRFGSLPPRWQLLLGAGLGLGLLSILVLSLGVAGVLGRPAWIGILTAFAVAGLVRAALQTRSARPSTKPAASTAPSWLWLLVCPFLALCVLVASVPPGYLWAEEGNGYDVLEYHLGMPKEYLEAGQITYAPHNVYANFPANIEMLYLLAMVLQGDAADAAGACKMLNAGLAILTVGVAWLIGRQRSSAAGIVAAVTAASVGWLTYLSGVAYVENGMLLFGMLALASLLRVLDGDSRRLQWCAVAGAFAGFSSGCKYSALALVALPLSLAILVVGWTTLRRRLAGTAAFALCSALTFAPWAIKNVAWTHNPVFPLAGSYFDRYPPGWGPEESEHFAASHAPGPQDRGLGRRLTLLWKHLPADADQRIGGLVFGLAGWALLKPRRDPAVKASGWMLLVQVPVWLFATHLYARFAVPLLIPLVALASRVPLGLTYQRRAAVALVIVGSLVNLGFAARLYAAHMVPGGVALPLEGATGYFTAGQGLGHEHLSVINQELPTDARILMVGDTKAFYFRREVDYCVVFNQSPFLQAAAAESGAADLHVWLAERGYTHVLVNWAEIERLRRSRYGFPSKLTPRDLIAWEGSALSRTQEFRPGDRPGAVLFTLQSTP